MQQQLLYADSERLREMKVGGQEDIILVVTSCNQLLSTDSNRCSGVFDFDMNVVTPLGCQGFNAIPDQLLGSYYDSITYTPGSSTCIRCRQ